jgi:hypothetical protein
LAQTDAAASVWSVRDFSVRAAALGIYDCSHEFSKQFANNVVNKRKVFSTKKGWISPIFNFPVLFFHFTEVLASESHYMLQKINMNFDQTKHIFICIS